MSVIIYLPSSNYKDIRMSKSPKYQKHHKRITKKVYMTNALYFMYSDTVHLLCVRNRPKLYLLFIETHSSKILFTFTYIQIWQFKIRTNFGNFDVDLYSLTYLKTYCKSFSMHISKNFPFNISNVACLLQNHFYMATEDLE